MISSKNADESVYSYGPYGPYGSSVMHVSLLQSSCTHPLLSGSKLEFYLVKALFNAIVWPTEQAECTDGLVRRYILHCPFQGRFTDVVLYARGADTWHIPLPRRNESARTLASSQVS